MQRVTPFKKPTQPKREIFVREVAGHLRSTTTAKTWLEWELDKNFDVFCNQVKDYETMQGSMRWLECEDRAWAHAKTLMEEQRTSSGALTFTNARAILVDHYSVSLQNDALINALQSSKNGSISRVQQILADYRRLAGSFGCSKLNSLTKEKLQTRTVQQNRIEASEGVDEGIERLYDVHAYEYIIVTILQKLNLTTEQTKKSSTRWH
jgi:hypothetical protein